MNRSKLILTFAALAALVSPSMSGLADEGQWPLSMVHKLDLAAAGIELSPDEIFNTEAPSLVDAICRVGGATGSFISKEGLILTNHHVAFDAVSRASTPERDHLRDGFVAPTLADEIPAEGYVCRITVGYRDVSAEVLAVVKPDMAPAARLDAIDAKRREIVEAEKKSHPDLESEVAVMFQGSQYVLFRYRTIRDVRMVCIPPRSVGEFGGETDNWIWPRHTGDFAFLRAYVGPDGKPADHSPKNVPFRPRAHLKVQPAGVTVGDAVFLLGYPGRTFRHQSSDYVRFDEEIKMPFVADLYAERIAILEAAGRDDRQLALRLAPRIKGMANTMKNFRGKMLGLDRLDLVARKAEEEAELAAWIASDPTRRETYGHVLPEIRETFTAMTRDTLLRYASIRLGSTPYWQVARFALRVSALGTDTRPDDLAPEALERVLAAAERREKGSLPDAIETELVGGLEMLLEIAPRVSIPALTSWCGDMAKRHGTSDPAKLAAAIPESTGLRSKETRRRLLLGPVGDEDRKDDLLALAGAIGEEVQAAQGRRRTHQGRLDTLMALYVDAKRSWKGEEFCPDANSTLRMTYGRIRAYTPRDGVRYHPITTLGGMVAKSTGQEPFDAPRKLLDLWRKKDFGTYFSESLGDVPVGILYDCDTTGGNSGSPVMNGKGELVGLNFDRAYEATINDYQWSADYSRSIGVDIRYVMWVTDKLMGAQRVIREMQEN